MSSVDSRLAELERRFAQDGGRKPVIVLAGTDRVYSNGEILSGEAAEHAIAKAKIVVKVGPTEWTPNPQGE